MSTSRRRCWRRRARAALMDRACARRNWHGARAHQIRRRMGQPGAALARGRGGGCEVFRAPLRAELGPTATARSAPANQTQSRVREWSTHYSPRAHVPLTRRLCPTGYGCMLPERARAHACAYPSTATSPSSTRSPRRLARRRLARRRHARRRHARRRLRLACAAPPAPRCLCRDACAATPAPRRLTPRRLYTLVCTRL